MSIINVVGVNFEEFEPGTYKSVYLHLANGTKMLFATGDPVADFRNALDYINSIGEKVIYSSTVDNFVMDDPDYGYVEEDGSFYIAKKTMYQTIYRDKFIDGSYGPYHVLADSDNSDDLIVGAKKFKELFPAREVIIICVDTWDLIQAIE